MNLRPPKLDVDSEGNGDEDEVCDELARTTFDMYFRSLLKHGTNLINWEKIMNTIASNVTHGTS